MPGRKTVLRKSCHSLVDVVADRDCFTENWMINAVHFLAMGCLVCSSLSGGAALSRSIVGRAHAADAVPDKTRSFNRD